MTQKEEAARIALVQAALKLFSDREPHERQALFGDTEIGATGKPKLYWQFILLGRLKDQGRIEHLNPSRKGAAYRWVAAEAPDTSVEAAVSLLWPGGAARVEPSMPAREAPVAPSEEAQAQQKTHSLLQERLREFVQQKTLPNLQERPQEPKKSEEVPTGTSEVLAGVSTEKKLDIIVANVVWLREELQELRPMIERIYKDLIR